MGKSAMSYAQNACRYVMYQCICHVLCLDAGPIEVANCQ